MVYWRRLRRVDSQASVTGRLFGIVTLLVLSMFAPSLCYAGTSGAAVWTASNIIVSIEARGSTDFAVGAGIILGYSKSSLYVVTASHVVYLNNHLAENVRVHFSFTPDTYQAKNIKIIRLPFYHNARGERGDDDDVAVVEIPLGTGLGVLVTAIDLKVLASDATLTLNEVVHTLGNPNGNPSTATLDGETFLSEVNGVMEFSAPSLAQGHSGGGLFDQNWHLVGMVMQYQKPLGSAVRISWILDSLRPQLVDALHEANTSISLEENSQVAERETTLHAEKGARVVASIEAVSTGGTALGSGIIVGFNDSTVYLVTARSTFFPKKELAHSVSIRLPFFNQPCALKAVKVLHYDTQLQVPGDQLGSNVVLVEIGLTPELKAAMSGIDLQVLGSDYSVAFGDSVHTMKGTISGSAEHADGVERFTARIGENLRFQTQKKGDSFVGSALFDEDWRLIGLVTDLEPPVGVATRLGWILKALKSHLVKSLALSGDDSKAIRELRFVTSNLTPSEKDLRESFEHRYAKNLAAGKIPLGLAELPANGQGGKELILEIQDPGYCGSDGCTWKHVIYRQNGDAWTYIAETDQCGDQISISRSHLVDGYPRIYCSGSRDHYSSSFENVPPEVYEWNGKSYLELVGTDNVGLDRAVEGTDLVDKIMKDVKVPDGK
jgi:hypothetical protein